MAGVQGGQAYQHLKQTRDFVAIYEICFTLSAPICDRCVTLKSDSLLKRLLCQRFPTWGNHHASQPMVLGRLCQLILISLWQNKNRIAKLFDNEKDTNSLGYYYKMMDSIGLKYRHLGLLDFHEDPDMSNALGLVTRRMTVGELFARLVHHTQDEVHGQPRYPGASLGPIRSCEVSVDQFAAQQPAAEPCSSPHLHVLLPFRYFGAFTSLPHRMQDRLYTICSGSAYLKMI